MPVVVEKVQKTEFYQFGKGKNIYNSTKNVFTSTWKNFLLPPEMEIIWVKARHCEHAY